MLFDLGAAGPAKGEIEGKTEAARSIEDEDDAWRGVAL
jgi:hypothetical protein